MSATTYSTQLQRIADELSSDFQRQLAVRRMIDAERDYTDAEWAADVADEWRSDERYTNAHDRLRERCRDGLVRWVDGPSPEC